MPSFEIQNFKPGLDTRRYELTSVPGSLETLVNGHINQGGEVENRKAFEQLPIPSSTYGAQETTTGIVVFGSRDVLGWTLTATTASGLGASATYIFAINTGGNFPPSIGDPIIVVSNNVPGANGNWVISGLTHNLPNVYSLTVSAPNATGSANPDTGTVVPYFQSPFIYQQLSHPTLVGITPTMNGVVSSTYFNGRTFVITTWSNGDTLVFYGSQLLGDFYIGLQSPLESTPYTMAQDLVAEVNATTNFTATINALSNLFFLVTGGSSGTITVQYKFQVAQQLTSFLATNLATIASAVAWTTSNNATASALANAITNATDAYAGGTGINLGFVGSTPGSVNEVSIAPPSGIQPGDQLIVSVTGNVTVFVPTLSATFTIQSVPTQTSAKPFTVTQVLENVNQTFKLISTGTPATAGANAVGQFTIFGGTSNNPAIGTITQSGQPTAGQTLTLGLTIYKFVSVLTGAINEVLIGSTAATSLANLANAINVGVGAGTVFGFFTTPNQQASAVITSGTVLTLTSSVGGTAGNGLTFSTTVTNFALVAFSGGGPNTNGISGITVAGVQLLGSAVQFNNSQNQTASDIVAGINNFSGTSGFNASANQNVVSIMSNATGTTYNGATVIVTSTGNVVTANCHFVIAPLFQQNISSITVGAGTANLLTATLTYQDSGHLTESLVQFLQRISTNINANSGSSLYTSWVDTVNQAIWISAVANSSADTTADIVITSTALISGTAISLLRANGNFQTQEVTGTFNGGSLIVTFSMTSNALINATGGITFYSYSWTVQGPTITNNAITGFSSTLSINDSTNPAQSVSGQISFATATAVKPVVFSLIGSVKDSSPTPQQAAVVFQIVVVP